MTLDVVKLGGLQSGTRKYACRVGLGGGRGRMAADV